MPRVIINQPSPDFTLVDYQGRTFRLSDQTKQGLNILLVFNRGFV